MAQMHERQSGWGRAPHPATWAKRIAAGVLVAAVWLGGSSGVQAQTMLPTVFNIPVFDTPVPGSVPAPHASFAVNIPDVQPILPRLDQGLPTVRKAEVRSSELRGLLPHQHDRHYFGLEAAQPGAAFAVTLLVDPAAALDAGSVNFVVLTEEGLQQFLAGADPLAVKSASGSPLLFDQVGNRLTALVPGSHDTGYTVIVYNNGTQPVAYTLQVQGGILRDDAGQTASAVTVDPADPAVLTPLAARDGMMERLALTPEAAPAQADLPELLMLTPSEPVKARRVSGVMTGNEDRHYFELATERDEGDIVLTLQTADPTVAPDQINFWVMTQDGVRHLIQGALPQELNLATGKRVAPGVYQARLRMAQGVLYTVVLYNEGEAADYALSVEGGLLVDRYGQSREAQVAALEIMALAGK